MSTAVRLRFARRRVGSLRTWRWPRFGSSPLNLGLVEGWRVEPKADVGLIGYVCLRFVADPCALSALTQELCQRLRLVGLDYAAVEVSLDHPWFRALALWNVLPRAEKATRRRDGPSDPPR